MRMCGALIGCVSLSVALAAPNPHAYELKRLPKVGDAARYQVAANFQFNGRTASMNMEQTEAVTKVETDSYEVKTSACKCRFSVDGKEQRLPDSEATSALYDRLGSLLNLHLNAPDDDAYRKANMLAFVAPEKAVQEGDKWEQRFKSNASVGVREAKTVFEVEKAERVGKHDAVVVKFDFAESEGEDPITSSGHVWVNALDGSVLKLEASFKNFPFNGHPMSGTFSMTKE
jgi:hypothetical protein